MNPLAGTLAVLLVFALYLWVVISILNDLYKPERRVTGFNKDTWAVIIVLFSIPGIVAYFTLGRQE